MPKKGKRIAKTIYFEDNLEKGIEAMCRKYNLSFSAVVCDAVEKQLRKTKGEAEDIEGRLQNLSTALHQHRERTGQDMFLLTELMLCFIRSYMTHTPGIPEDQEKAAKADGGARFEEFLEEFQRSLLSEGGVSRELFKDEE